MSPKAAIAAPRGVIVTRANGADAFRFGDDWRKEDRSDGCWLIVIDLDGRKVAEYKPDYWLYVEAGHVPVEHTDV